MRSGDDCGSVLYQCHTAAGTRLLAQTLQHPHVADAVDLGVNSQACPTARLRTTGFAIVASTTDASFTSLAKPWWKSLVLEPHASNAAFIDGAAIARSKNPPAREAKGFG
jgi:hypothetical protein